jgi:very-short-patch-repair endonuclease
MGESQKLSYEFVKNKISELGYDLVSTKYKNAKVSLIIKDDNGYLYYSRYYNLCNGKKPQYVSCDNPFTIRNIKHYIILNDLRCELLSESYTDSKQEMLFRCRCGKEYKCMINKFLYRDKYLCNSCSQKKKARQRLHDISSVKKFFDDNGYTLLSSEYKGVNAPLVCRDTNGFIGTLSYANLKTGYSFNAFSTVNPYVATNIDKYIENNNLKCKLLTRDFSTWKTLQSNKIELLCNCGNLFSTDFRTFMHAGVHRCQTCSKKKSQYELLTDEYLAEINVKYDSQYTFVDCVDVQKLRFDYHTMIDRIHVVIEVDGQFHYKNMYGDKFLFEQQRRDALKNDYCKRNGVKVIRIPYWEYKSNNYKNIIMKGLLSASNP